MNKIGVLWLTRDNLKATTLIVGRSVFLDPSFLNSYFIEIVLFVKWTDSHPVSYFILNVCRFSFLTVLIATGL